MLKSSSVKTRFAKSRGRPTKDEADLSLRGAHEARQATALARHRLPAILLFQCADCGHVDMIEWPEFDGEEAP